MNWRYRADWIPAYAGMTVNPHPPLRGAVADQFAPVRRRWASQ